MTTSLRFTRAQRLSLARQFQAVYAARARKQRRGLMVSAAPNGLELSRLGLAVSRAAGNAVARNRVKRLLREAFRLDQHDLPKGYDIVAGVRTPVTLPLAAYRELLKEMLEELDREWGRRQRRAADSERPPN